MIVDESVAPGEAASLDFRLDLHAVSSTSCDCHARDPPCLHQAWTDVDARITNTATHHPPSGRALIALTPSKSVLVRVQRGVCVLPLNSSGFNEPTDQTNCFEARSFLQHTLRRIKNLRAQRARRSFDVCAFESTRQKANGGLVRKHTALPGSRFATSRDALHRRRRHPLRFVVRTGNYRCVASFRCKRRRTRSRRGRTHRVDQSLTRAGSRRARASG